MWLGSLIIKGVIWVFKIATENFVSEYAKKQASKLKYKFKLKSK